MSVKFTGGTGWEVQVIEEETCRTYSITRTTTSGYEMAVCSCGAYWDTRFKKTRRCPHMRTVEAYVEQRARQTEREVSRFFE